MPIFEFACPKCHRTVEKLFARVAVADATTVRCLSRICPGMQRAVMVRIPTAAGFVLKGSGFHSIDYPKRP